MSIMSLCGIHLFLVRSRNCHFPVFIVQSVTSGTFRISHLKKPQQCWFIHIVRTQLHWSSEDLDTSAVPYCRSHQSSQSSHCLLPRNTGFQRSTSKAPTRFCYDGYINRYFQNLWETWMIICFFVYVELAD